MPKLGEALKALVSENLRAEEGTATQSVLMNRNRRRVFEFVAWHPCATASEVAQALAVSDPTAAWHLAKLAEAEYVQEARRGRRRVFHATALGLTEPEVEGFAALGEPGASRTLRHVLATPGLTAGELAAKAKRPSARRPLHALLAAGLVVTVQDGRYRRYYPGAVVSAIERAAPRRLRDFRRRLLRKLQRDRLAPEVRLAPDDVAEIDVRFGEERATLRLPVGSLLVGRLG